MGITIRAMTADDYALVIGLWRRTEGMGLGESDTEQATAAYLRRNAGMSAVCLSEGGDLIGAVLCGHDGRSGYLHHLAVDPTHRLQGVAAQLLEYCFERLHEAGIQKCKIFLYRDNLSGASFWNHNGWSPLRELLVLQKATSSTK
jgi:ribosomal protein S18 acetylase RimI-like enzyme